MYRYSSENGDVSIIHWFSPCNLILASISSADFIKENIEMNNIKEYFNILLLYY